MRNKIKPAAVIITAILVLIQLFRPARNLSNNNQNAIGKKYPVPDSVEQILKTSCFDCHSNYTVYPWYANIQPVAWYLAHHINEGNEHLNFSEFLSYPVGRQYHLMHGIQKQIKEHNMPLGSYTLIHTYAKLSDEQSETLIKWAEGISTTIKNTYPADSLVDKQHGRRH